MVKKLLCVLLLCNMLNAGEVIDKVSSLVDSKKFVEKKKLIEIIFEDKQSYKKQNGDIDNLKIIAKLKEMGLLDLFFKEPSKLFIEFQSDSNPLLTMKVISESLKSIGYSYFITKKASNNKNGFIWKIYMTTRQAVDPISLADQFSKRDIRLLDISRDKKDLWVYKISVKDAKVLSEEVELNSNTKLTKPLNEYWIDVKDAKSVSIEPSHLDNWHPKIFFLDANLHTIKSLHKNEKTRSMKIDIPENSRYMIVCDIYTLANIKRGLDILLSTQKD